MIVAEIYKDKSGKMSGFSIYGHANNAPHGYDIYCAGVSTLTQSALLCIKNHLKRDITFEAEHGILNMKLKTPPDDLTEAVFQTMTVGLVEIEKLAPQAVKLKFVKK